MTDTSALGCLIFFWLFVLTVALFVAYFWDGCCEYDPCRPCGPCGPPGCPGPAGPAGPTGPAGAPAIFATVQSEPMAEPIVLTDGTYQAITSVTLTPGIWQIWANVQGSPTGPGYLEAGITDEFTPGDYGPMGNDPRTYVFEDLSFAGTLWQSMPIVPFVWEVNTTTTYYLKVGSAQDTSYSMFGAITANRFA